MAVGLPLKTTYADGDVFSASDINDTNGTINTTAALFAAGKNKIINGDFGIWQRGTSFATSLGYTADRMISASDATIAQTRQTFTPGTAPVAGYEGSFFIRLAKSAGGNYSSVEQRIEDVRTFAGQTATFSFWLKSSAATTIRVRLTQQFGSGGSTAVDNTATDFSSTTSWTRYSLVFNVASIAGKTIGTNSYFNAAIINVTAAAVDVDVWGMQLEAGSTATAFQTATGTIQGELAACQRYYYRHTAAQNNTCFGVGMNQSTTAGNHYIKFATTMRTAPTSVDFSTLQITDFAIYGAAITTLAIVAAASGVDTANLVSGGASGMTSQLPSFLRGATAGTSYIAFSAEL
jgi:hypothetical protein